LFFGNFWKVSGGSFMAFVIIKFYPYTMNANLEGKKNANCQLVHNYIAWIVHHL